MITRLQEVAGEFLRADEALRKALLRAERAERIWRAKNQLLAVRQPRRVWVTNERGERELWSLPL